MAAKTTTASPKKKTAKKAAKKTTKKASSKSTATAKKTTKKAPSRSKATGKKAASKTATPPAARKSKPSQVKERSIFLPRAVASVDDQADKALFGASLLLLQQRLPADEVRLVPLDEPLQATFEHRVVRAQILLPAAVAFFDPK